MNRLDIKIYVVEYGNEGICGEGEETYWEVFTDIQKALDFCKHLNKVEKYQRYENILIYKLTEDKKDKGCWRYKDSPEKNYADDFVPPPKTEEEKRKEQEFYNSPMGKLAVENIKMIMGQKTLGEMVKEFSSKEKGSVDSIVIRKPVKFEKCNEST